MFATRFLIFLAPAATYAGSIEFKFFTDDTCKTAASADEAKPYTDTQKGVYELLTDESSFVDNVVKGKMSGCLKYKSGVTGNEYATGKEAKSQKMTCTASKIVSTIYEKEDCKGEKKETKSDFGKDEKKCLEVKDLSSASFDPKIYAKGSCTGLSFAGRTTMVIPVLASSLLFVFINAV